MYYSNLYNGSYSLSKDNMKLHLMQENEQKLIEIDNIHLEKKIIQIKKIEIIMNKLKICKNYQMKEI